jgi:glutamate carboxypeptidase
MSAIIPGSGFERTRPQTEKYQEITRYMLSLSDFEKRRETITQLLRQLVEHESPSHDKAAVDRLGAFISAQAEQRGAAVETVHNSSVGDVLILRWTAGAAGEPVLVLCHMDTVHPLGSLGENPCRIEDRRLYGPGALDMKAGIAILLDAVEALRASDQLPGRPITALITSDEETGSAASRQWIEQLARESALVLCLEPSLANGALKTWRKGVGHFTVTARGRAAHAGGEHELGRNAIEELAHHVLAVQGLTNYEKGTTLNVGLIQGGTTTNVVPAEARMEVDLRVMVPEEAERIQAELRKIKPVLEGTVLEVEGELNRPPMPRDARMMETYEKARVIGARLGLDLLEGGTGGGSDANFVAPLGVAVLDGLGGRGEGMHSEREYVLVDSLPERAALLAAILTDW